jgi:oxygen-independent coproporphyrinogen-3 oxidase
VEEPYVDAVLAEWRIYLDELGFVPRIREIHLGGGTPTFMAPWELSRLISGILDTSELCEDYCFSFEAHPSSTSVEHLETLAGLGFTRLSVGVQDVSPKILKAINRHQTTPQITQVVDAARSLDYDSINYDLIYGLPFQTLADVDATMDHVAEAMPDRIAFYSYAHVPWKSPGQRAFTKDDVPAGAEKYELYQLGRQRLLDLGYMEIGMDHFCLPDEALAVAYQEGSMHRNFMGYTPFTTSCMIALGCSSISDSGTTYVQNEKTVEAYQDLVLAGKLPIVKGHQLSEDEVIMRQHILDLFCRDATSWLPSSRSETLIGDLVGNLRDLQQDGAVETSLYSIDVSPSGRTLIRNICAAIDHKMQGMNRNQQIFSKAI